MKKARRPERSKGLAHAKNPLSQPSMDISPIWTPISATDVRKLQRHPVWIMYGKCFLVNIQRISFV
jgi:hypothetical protein